MKANPELVATISKVSAGLVGFRVATLAGTFVMRNLLGALLTVLKPITMLSGGLLGRGVLPALLSRMRLVTRALVALRGALLFSGVGAILLAIAGAGEFIRDNWTGLGTFFREFGASLETALGAETSAKIQPLLSALKELGAWMTSGSWKIDDATWRDGARRLVRTSRPR